MKEMKMCLLISLLLAGVRCIKDSLYIYNQVGEDVLLSCTNLNSRCSFVSWIFYKGGYLQYSELFSRGRFTANSDTTNRIDMLSNCSLVLRGLQVDDAGSYICQEHQEDIAIVHLSVFTIMSPTGVMELRPGGTLVLSCLLFTYYDIGSCSSYTKRFFKLSWHTEDGAELKGDRHQLMDSRCNVTVITTLLASDHSRRWRCQVNTTNASRVHFMDFTSRFWAGPDPSPSEAMGSALLVGRMALCVALPLMVVTVGLFTWRLDHRKSRAVAAGPDSFKLQEIS